jgi:hypothetical protein
MEYDSMNQTGFVGFFYIILILYKFFENRIPNPYQLGRGRVLNIVKTH